MRTSILGIHDWWDTDAVERNAVAICKVTHRDPRYSINQSTESADGSGCLKFYKPLESLQM